MSLHADPFIGGDPPGAWDREALYVERYEYEQGPVRRRPSRSTQFQVCFYSAHEDRELRVDVEVDSEGVAEVLTEGLCESDREHAKDRAEMDWRGQ